MSSSSWPDVSDSWTRLSRAVQETADSLAHTAGDVSASATQFAGSLSETAREQFGNLKLTIMPPPPPSPPANSLRLSRKAWTLVAVGVAGIAAYSAYSLYQITGQTTRKRRRRFAKTAPDGGRSEVVLLVGTPAEPLAAMIAQDLNLRGFIVYMTSTAEEQEWLTSEKSPDIRPLIMNVTDGASVSHAIHELDRILKTPVATLAGATPHRLSLVGAILLPDMHYLAGPLETAAPYTVQQTVDSKILMPFTVLNGGLIDFVRRHRSRIVLVTPSIMGSLNPAFHSFESAATAALAAMALSVSRELQPQGIPFVHVKLGSFDTGYSSRSQQNQIVKNMRADILTWPDTVRPFYAGAYAASAHLQTNRNRGAKLAVLHHTIFDVLTAAKPPRVVHIGSGSYSYELVSRWVPERLLTLLLANAGNAQDDI